MNQESINVAVIGLGYWGPNRLRALNEIGLTDVTWICDTDLDRLERHARRHPSVRTTTDVDELLADDDLDAVVIATPVFSHNELTERCLLAGKHVFVEKPLAATELEAIELERLAVERDRVLACGHTFMHSPPVRLIKGIIDSGELGEIYSVSSSRVNLGPYRSDVSVIFDLGPHDFSILRYWFGHSPISVSAIGRDAISNGIADVAFVHMELPNGLIAHAELSWLAPSKLRRTVIVGSEKMLVYEDGTAEPVRIFDSGISYTDPETFGEYQLSYRTGDIVSLRVDATEPIIAELLDFAGAITEGRQPLSGAEIAIDVIRTVEAAEASMNQGGQRVSVVSAASPLAGQGRA